MNQYDVTASLLTDFFTSKPDFTPYTLELSDPRIFNVTKAMKKYHRDIDWRKVIAGPDMDDVKEIKATHYGEKKSAANK